MAGSRQASFRRSIVVSALSVLPQAECDTEGLLWGAMRHNIQFSANLVTEGPEICDHETVIGLHPPHPLKVKRIELGRDANGVASLLSLRLPICKGGCS